MTRDAIRTTLTAAVALAAMALASPTRADAITDWNTKAGEIVVESELGTPPEAIDAAVAAADRTVMLKRLPAQEASFQAAHAAALARIAEGAAKSGGLLASEEARAALRPPPSGAMPPVACRTRA
ncbi:MAG TPA: hypothetical protein VFU71_16015 [Burkholderiaceae bacterium]|nr:hypothetical protein [Burkholderiaceae bacterium]